MAEQKTLEQEERILACGGSPRDISEVLAWRETTDMAIQQAISFYSWYLGGQTNGMSDALSLPAVIAACDIEDVDKDTRPLLTRLLLKIHGCVMDIVHAESKLAANRG